MDTIPIKSPSGWRDYSLLDSGGCAKLEIFGGYNITRPDPRAIWEKNNLQLWENADAIFVRTSDTEGNWETKNPPPNNWQIRWENLVFSLKPGQFKHTGVFPEQAVNWGWIKDQINDKPLSILNLFAYTGGATMAAAAAGARVVHLDASKSAISWAKENIELSKLGDSEIRWIEDDAMKFVEREIRRNNKYDGIILDPPRFGRGTSGEVWKIEKDLPELLKKVKQLLSPAASFVLLNVYTADLSPIAVDNLMKDIFPEHYDRIETAELALKEINTNRYLPAGIVSRWKK